MSSVQAFTATESVLRLLTSDLGECRGHEEDLRAMLERQLLVHLRKAQVIAAQRCDCQAACDQHKTFEFEFEFGMSWMVELTRL